MIEQTDTPLPEKIHDRDIANPETLIGRGYRGGWKSPIKKNWHPVAAAVAKFGSLLQLYGHRWNKREKLLYRRATESVKHPCCPNCGKPMNELVITTALGEVHKAWYCEKHQNL